MRRDLARLLLAMLLIGLTLFAPPCWPLVGVARGESGSVISLPQVGRKIKSEWVLEVDTRGPSAPGYRALRFKAQLRPGSSPAKWDRTLRIQVNTSAYWYGSYQQSSVIGHLTVPQGATGGECTILVQQHQELNQFQLHFSEDGESVEDLDGHYGVANWNGTWSEATPSVLVVDSDAPTPDDRTNWAAAVRARLTNPKEKAESLPDVHKLARLTMLSNQSLFQGSGAHPSDPVVIEQLQFCPRFNLIPPQSLPKKWLEISSYDLVVISLKDLRRTAEEHPPAFAALQAWTTSGRVLCVTGAGADFAKLDEIERLLAMPPLDDATTRPRRSWSSPSPDDFAQTSVLLSGAARTQQAGVTYAMQNGMVVATQPAAQADPEPNVKVEPNEAVAKKRNQLADSFVWRRWGSGSVVAMADENPFPGDDELWNGVLNTLPATQWAWYLRQGMSLIRHNPGFWNGWIPGIGKAPVTSFLILISIFVVVIGPVNYVWLRRRKRPFLMLVTVPVGAGLVAFFLVSYALIADGLGVQMRQRSFTWLDQRAGRTATWSRQTYYAGLPPGGGLLYPTDATVFPLEPHPEMGSRSGNYQLLEWSDEGQRLKSGYLASRTMQQFMVTRATTSEATLDFRQPIDESGRRDAVNRLGSAVQAALLRDEEGRLHWSEGGADREPLRFEPISVEDARKRLSELLQAANHDSPEGIQVLERSWSRRYMWGAYNNIDSQLPQPNVFTGLLETQVRMAADPDNLARRSYVVFTSRSPFVPLGVQEYSEQGSLHIILGQW